MKTQNQQFKLTFGVMKKLDYATYPMAFLRRLRRNVTAEVGRVFDEPARSSYFKSLEIAQRNLSYVSTKE